MIRFILCLLLAAPLYSFAQLGVKAGLNFANVTNASSVSNSSRTGFHAGVFIAPPTQRMFGSRTEIVFSRQGYNFKTSTNTGSVNLDYIILPQYMTINITKYLQVQLGAQIAFLLNAKVDSSNNSGGDPTAAKIMDVYNRIDYGFGGGIEIHPVSGLLVGARFNVSLGDLYKNPGSYAAGSFIPKTDVKNNVFQLFAGWRFGGKKQSKHQEN